MSYKNRLMGFRATESEAREIEEMARAGGFLSKSHYLRSVILTHGNTNVEEIVRILQAYNAQIVKLRQEIV